MKKKRQNKIRRKRKQKTNKNVEIPKNSERRMATSERQTL
jgi:hypothetical protein